MLRRNVLLAALTRCANDVQNTSAESLVSIYKLDYETAEEIIRVFETKGSLMIAALIMNDPIYLDKTLLTPAINSYIHDTKSKHMNRTRVLLCPNPDISVVMSFDKGEREYVEPFIYDGALVTDIYDVGKLVIIQFLSNQGVELNRLVVNSYTHNVHQKLMTTPNVCFLRIWKVYKNYHIDGKHISFYSTLHQVSNNHISKRCIPDRNISLPLDSMSHSTMIGGVIVESIV